jgi:hypothetical protein
MGVRRIADDGLKLADGIGGMTPAACLDGMAARTRW